MPIRLSGLASGMDTDSMVKELVKASSSKKTDLEKAQTKLGWKQETWKNLNTKIYSFFNTSLNNMRMQGSYNKKSTIVANSNVASVVAGDNATNGTQTLSVDRLAKSGYLTGGKLSENKKYTKDTTMEAMGVLGAGETSKIKVTSNGKEKTVELTSGMKVSELVTKLGEAGVTANFDAENQRFFISAKGSGKNGDFTLTAENSNGLESLSKLGLLTKEEINGNPEYAEWAAMKGATEADTIANPKFAEKVTVEMATRAANLKKQNDSWISNNKDILAQIDKLQTGKQKFIETDSYKDAMKAIDPSGTNTLEDNIALAKTYVTDTKAEIARLTELQKKLEDGGGIMDDAFTADEKTEFLGLLDKAQDGSWEKLPDFEKNLKVLNSAKEYDDEIKKGHDMIAANDAKMADNSLRFTVSTDADGKETITGTSLLQSEVEKDFVIKVNVAKEAIDKAGSMTPDAGENGPKRIKGEDAKIKLNGAEFTSNSNTFSVNGLTITAKEVSTSETTINTDTDVEGIYKQIKDFLGEYNKLIKEMDGMYNAKSSKGYDPLTKEEKAELGESEIKDWEQKIKDSLLRKDSTLNTVKSVMKSAMTEGFMVGGERLSLTSFGIETQSYFNAPDNEKGVYHIAGDTSDAASPEKDILKTTIAANPEKVSQFFSQFTENAYQKLNTEMRSIKNYRSIYNVYDDKKMATDYKDYTDKIATQAKKLTALENRYYKQFTAMEKAMSKLNSTQSSFSSLLGSS